MSRNLVTLILSLLVLSSALTGIAGLFALIRRGKLSRTLGVISISCLVVGLLTAVVHRGRPHWQAWLAFFLFLIPGALAIVFNRPRIIPPGHCTSCGYNLTGNVSGKCSECGAPVVAP